MFRKSLMLSLIVLVVSSFSLVAFAQDNTDADSPHFTDGRVNAYDIAAPVVIFYDQEDQQVYDANGLSVMNEDGSYQYQGVTTGLSLVGVDRSGTIFGVMTVTPAQIKDALVKGKTTFESKGFTLGIGADGWYYVIAPSDAEGKVYTFQWDDLGRTLPAGYVLPQP